MKIQLSLMGILVLAYSSAWSAVDWSNSDALCAHIGMWEEINVVGLNALEHREIMASDQTSAYLPTRHVVGPVRIRDYVLRVVVDTEQRHGSITGSEQITKPAGADRTTCEGIVRQFSDENLVDLDIVSSTDMSSEYPAGASLKDLFDVSVELSLKNGSVPEGILSQRNIQTLAQYVSRGSKQPLVVNLRLNNNSIEGAAHVFDVVMFMADGNTHSAQSGPVMFVQDSQ